MAVLGEEARRLQLRHSESADQIATKQAEIVGLWEAIKRKASKRASRLEDAQRFQKFLGDYRYVTIIDQAVLIYHIVLWIDHVVLINHVMLWIDMNAWCQRMIHVVYELMGANQ